LSGSGDLKDGESSDSLILDERAEKQKVVLKKVGVKMREKLATLKGHFTKTLTELKANVSGDESQDISGLIFSYLEKLCVEYINFHLVLVD